ncbi:hypothetical protein ACSEQ4_11950 [Pseudomonas aeruginosa]
MNSSARTFPISCTPFPDTPLFAVQPGTSTLEALEQAAGYLAIALECATEAMMRGQAGQVVSALLPLQAGSALVTAAAKALIAEGRE